MYRQLLLIDFTGIRLCQLQQFRLRSGRIDTCMQQVPGEVIEDMGVPRVGIEDENLPLERAVQQIPVTVTHQA